MWDEDGLSGSRGRVGGGKGSGGVEIEVEWGEREGEEEAG